MTVPFDIADGNKQKIISTSAFTCEEFILTSKLSKCFTLTLCLPIIFMIMTFCCQTIQDIPLYARLRALRLSVKCEKDVLQVILIALSASLVGVDMS